MFIPMRDSVDAETQIAAGDLFDFDLEVEPILEVLVGKTLEQGMIEVMEEEELAAMKQHQVCVQLLPPPDEQSPRHDATQHYFAVKVSAPFSRHGQTLPQRGVLLAAQALLEARQAAAAAVALLRRR